MEIYRNFTFEAAHRLPNVPAGHKCGRLHGHSFSARVWVAGKPDPTTGWIVDFDEIKQAFRAIHDELDHNYLNEIAGLENPTSEHLARWIWRKLRPKLRAISRVEVSETCNSGCLYLGDDE
jgi:6-pyruvoyltetrahydropterin/6-carboxytetrahydropterin synthase